MSKQEPPHAATDLNSQWIGAKRRNAKQPRNGNTSPDASTRAAANAPGPSISISKIPVGTRVEESPLGSGEQQAEESAQTTLSPKGKLKKPARGKPPMDPEFNRNSEPLEIERRLIPTTKKLFNPATDPIPTMSREEAQIVRRNHDQSTNTFRPGKAKREQTAGGANRAGGGGKGRRGQAVSGSTESHLMGPNQNSNRDGRPFMMPRSPGDVAIKFLKQPETRPISHEQLVAEVKGIYAGLVMVEAKCVEVDAKQAAFSQQGREQQRLNNEQWQALIALHRTLLHEHHDFFLASQHPSASPSLRRLASKYAMPARMWRHGIHSFLELLRHRLPDSLEHMLTFIYLAYSMMALLYETVPAFVDTWIECLGDLGRYRMAIEDEDVRDREVWTNVARFWYSKATDKTPSVGRLYHHLAILARPNILQQLFFYCKALTVSQCFSSARESILTLFDPLVYAEQTAVRSHPVDAAFIKTHGILFTSIQLDKFEEQLSIFVTQLEPYITKAGSRWRTLGVHIAVCNVAALFNYGDRSSVFRKDFTDLKKDEDEKMQDAPPANATPAQGQPTFPAEESVLPALSSSEASSEHVTSLLQPVSKLEQERYLQNLENVEPSLQYAVRLFCSSLSVVLRRVDDPNVMPHVLVILIFMNHVKTSDLAISVLETEFPWALLCTFLNSLMKQIENDARVESRVESQEFPKPEGGSGRPLPEDWLLRGLDWSRKAYPEGWFADAQVDDDERQIEQASTNLERKERVLWTAMRFSDGNRSLQYDGKRRQFFMSERCKMLAVQAKPMPAFRYLPPAHDASMQDEASDDSLSEDYDMVDIPTESESNVGDNASTEVTDQFRQLKTKKTELEKQLSGGGAGTVDTDMLDDPRRDPGSLEAGYTAIVTDTSFLLSDLGLFKMVLESRKFPLVVPNVVATELRGLFNDKDVGNAAKDAIGSITEGIQAKRDIKVITAKGSNVTHTGFFREKIENYKSEGPKVNLDDIIISTALFESEQKKKKSPNMSPAEHVVLVSGDKGMRIKAQSRGITPISALVLKNALTVV